MKGLTYFDQFDQHINTVTSITYVRCYAKYKCYFHIENVLDFTVNIGFINAQSFRLS